MFVSVRAQLMQHRRQVERGLRAKANRRTRRGDPGFSSRRSAPCQVVAVSRECTRASDSMRPVKLSTNRAGSFVLRNVCWAIAWTLASVFLTR